MKTKTWIDEASSLNSLMQSLAFKDAYGKVISADLAFKLWSDWAIELKKN